MGKKNKNKSWARMGAGPPRNENGGFSSEQSAFTEPCKNTESVEEIGYPGPWFESISESFEHYGVKQSDDDQPPSR